MAPPPVLRRLDASILMTSSKDDMRKTRAKKDLHHRTVSRKSTSPLEESSWKEHCNRRLGDCPIALLFCSIGGLTCDHTSLTPATGNTHAHCSLLDGWPLPSVSPKVNIIFHRVSVRVLICKVIILCEFLHHHNCYNAETFVRCCEKKVRKSVD
jgi:hypothetical protein